MSGKYKFHDNDKLYFISFLLLDGTSWCVRQKRYYVCNSGQLMVGLKKTTQLSVATSHIKSHSHKYLRKLSNNGERCPFYVHAGSSPKKPRLTKLVPARAPAIERIWNPEINGF